MPTLCRLIMFHATISLVSVLFPWFLCFLLILEELICRTNYWQGANDCLQTVLRTNPYFQAEYVPISEKISSDSTNFPLEPLLSNSSYEGNLNDAWTYFLLDIPSGAAGVNLHIKLTTDAKTNYEIYAKYGGLPSPSSWDYYFANPRSSSNISMLLKPYDADNQTVSYYILYIRSGTWSVGLRQLNNGDTASKNQTTMSISLERCPRGCSSPHGKCESSMEQVD